MLKLWIGCFITKNTFHRLGLWWIHELHASARSFRLEPFNPLCHEKCRNCGPALGGSADSMEPTPPRHGGCAGNSCRGGKSQKSLENYLGYSMLFDYLKSHSVTEAKEHERYLNSSSLDTRSWYLLVCKQTSPTISADSTKVWSTLEHFAQPAADSFVSILGFWVR